MLILEDLRMQIEKLSIEVSSLTVSEGELFVLVGPSGAGKSKLLEAISGFIKIGRGRIHISGQDATNRPPERRKVSIIFQEPFLFPHLNVRDNIRFASRDPGTFHDVVEMLGLAPHLEKPSEVLSGGERQLTAIARALMTQPRVLLLDEAFSAIDPQHRRKVLKAFRAVQRKLDITTLAVTHNFEEALYLGSRLGVMIQGKVLQMGKPEEVFLRPSTPEVARFLGVENLFSGRFESLDAQGRADHENEARQAVFQTDGLTLHVLAEHPGPGYVLIHPQEITLSVSAPSPSSALNRLKGRITEIHRSGPVFRISVDAGLPFRVFVTPQSCRELGLTECADVYLTFKAAAVLTY